MNDTPLRRIDTPIIDTAIVEILETALAEARSGTLTGIAIIKSQRGSAWQHAIAGDTLHHAAAGLNLRIDLLKRELLNLWEARTDE